MENPIMGKWIDTGKVYCCATIYKCPVCGEEIDEKKKGKLNGKH